MHDDAKRLLREGRDPRYEAKFAKLANTQRHEYTFEGIAREWHELQKERWSAIHAADVISSMERDLFPALGGIAMADINEHLVISTLQAGEARGAIETAHRLRHLIASVFKFARLKKIVTHNPADVGELLKAVPRGRRWPALLDLDDIRDLVAAVDRAGANPVTRLASRFMALTTPRPGMIRSADWSEFHDISWNDDSASDEHAYWLITAGRMKLELELKGDDAFDHKVPLARQAIETLILSKALSAASCPCRDPVDAGLVSEEIASSHPRVALISRRSRSSALAEAAAHRGEGAWP